MLGYGGWLAVGPDVHDAFVREVAGVAGVV